MNLTTEDLLMFYHFSNELVNQAIAQKVIQDFEKNILGESIDWEIKEKDLNMECLEIKKVLNIINTWGYDKNYSENVFNLLARYDFRMNLVMLDAMESLGKLENPNRNKETIATFLNTPFINDISFNGKDTFIIISEKLGNLTFYLVS